MLKYKEVQIMISAKEARENYNKYGVLANRFIEKYIEPEIVSASLNSTEVTMDALAKWYRGETFKFPTEFKKENDFDDITLTNNIIDVLKSYGYEVAFEEFDWDKLNEYYAIADIVATISWKEVM